MLASRIRELTKVSQGQLQALKISRYDVPIYTLQRWLSRAQEGQEFSVHTDAIVPHKS